MYRLFTIFDLDFPDVIGVRDQLLPASDRVTHVASSAFDFEWLDALDVSRETPVMVIAEGLFCYCEESQVRELFLQLSQRFQNAHVLFQSISPRYVGRESQVGAVNKTRGGENTSIISSSPETPVSKTIILP